MTNIEQGTARATASAPKAELTEQRIFDLAAEHEKSGNGLYGPVTFAPTGLISFARAVLAQAAPVADDNDVICDRRDLFDFLRVAWRDGQDHSGEMDESERWSKASDHATKAIREWGTLRPAAPAAAPAPADGWKRNDGIQPVADDVLVAVIFMDGFRDTGKASSFIWEIDGVPLDITYYYVLPATPAPEAQ